VARAPARGRRVVFAPYRVCLVGAHIDHQKGTVTGFALDRGMALSYAASSRPGVTVTDEASDGIVSLDGSDTVLGCDGAESWAPFVQGAASVLGPREVGLEATVAGSLPPGGLSSSAALSLALLSAFGDVTGRPPARDALPRLAVRIEHEFVGVKCGLLDPTIIANAAPDSMVVLDCATEEVEVVPGPEAAIVAVYSGVPRSLVSTGFNNRARECREAARLVAERWGERVDRPVEVLGDLPLDVLARYADELPYPFSNRARHFLAEHRRAVRAVGAWRRRDLEGFGRCANESLESSIANYETGSPEQKVLARILCEAPGVYGARFCGGGFGGFAAGVCDPMRADEAAEWAVARYREAVPEYAYVAFSLVSRPSEGLRWLV